MKKLTSLILAVIMVISVAGLSFGAASGRVTAANKPIDTNNTTPTSTGGAVVDFYALSPGTVIEYPLTADMFTWSGTAGEANEAVTRAQVGSNLRTSLRGSGQNVIDTVQIVYAASTVTGGATTATVRVTFVKNLASTTAVKFNLDIFLTLNGNRQSNSRLNLQGELGNTPYEVYPGEGYVDIADGRVLIARGYIRNLDIYLGGNVTVTTNVFDNQRFYGTVTDSPKAEDDKVLSKYTNITDILYVNSVNLNKSGTTVQIDVSSLRYVYNANGKYIGTTNQKLSYSTKYYLSARNLGDSIDVSSAGTGESSSSSTSSSSSSSSSTGGGVVGTAGTIAKDAGVKDMQAAIVKANNNGSRTALVTYKNISGITAEALKAMSATAKTGNKTGQINADTVSGGVVGRITINPALAAKLTADTKFGLRVDSTSTRAVSTHFNKWFSNNMAFASFEHNGGFGMNVTVAVKVGLSGLNTKNLRLYTFNSSTNKYAQVKDANIWVDANGYLRFTTNQGGDLVISDGALTKK